MESVYSEKRARWVWTRLCLLKLNEVMGCRALHDKSGWGVVGLPDQIGPWKTNMLERWVLDGNRTRLEPVRSVALVQLGSLSGASWIGEPVVEAILLPLHSSPNSDCEYAETVSQSKGFERAPCCLPTGNWVGMRSLLKEWVKQQLNFVPEGVGQREDSWVTPRLWSLGGRNVREWKLEKWGGGENKIWGFRQVLYSLSQC